MAREGVTVTVSLPAAHADRLEQLAAEHAGGNKSAMIRLLLDSFEAVTKSGARLPREATVRG